MFLDPFFFPNVIHFANVCKIKDRYISLILKNASTSIHKYAEDNNLTVTSIGDICENLSSNQKIVVDVVIRHPIDRYFSALDTVKKVYNLDSSVVTPEQVDKSNFPAGMFVENHYYPQYLFCIAAYIQSECNNNLYFNFIGIDEINDLIGNIHLNKRSLTDQSAPPAHEKHIIKQKYYFDLQIYNHLIGKTCNLVQLIRFFEEYLDYRHPGLLGIYYPKYIHYLNQINPENHNNNYEKEIAKYKNVFDNFTSEYNKINKP